LHEIFPSFNPNLLPRPSFDGKFFLFICGAEVGSNPLLLRPLIGLFYQPWMRDGDDCGTVSGMNEWLEKPKYSEKIQRKLFAEL
jgi:hypothetical protein